MAKSLQVEAHDQALGGGSAVWVAWWAAEGSSSYILGAFSSRLQAKRACAAWVPDEGDGRWADDEIGSRMSVPSDLAGRAGTWHIMAMTVHG